MIFNRSTLSVLLAVTITAGTADALSIHRPSLRISSRASALNLTPRDDLSDYGKQKQQSELDSLISKRDQIRKARIANTKPNDSTPPINEMTKMIEEMSDAEVQAMMAKKMAGGGDAEGDADGATGGSSDDLLGGMDIDIDDMFSRDYKPDFKTKRFGSANRGLSAGDAGGVLDDPDAPDDPDANVFVDWAEDEMDDNEFHIPNRIGFTTADWGNSKAGFVSGKLKKKDRKEGKFNKADLKVSA